MYICNENVKILNELPMKKWKDGMCVDNKSMVGMSIDVEYKGKVYEGIEILEYIRKGKHSKFKVVYEENDFEIDCGHFLKGKLGKILGTYTNEFKIELWGHFKDDKRDLVIVDRKIITNDRGHRKDNEKWYKYKCNKCGWDEGWILENNLNRGNGCACCCKPPREVVLGINTIWDTDRWMCDLGVSEEDAKKYTRSSDKRIQYELEIHKIENDIQRLKWVLE